MDEEKLDLILEKISEIEEQVNDTNNIIHSQRNAQRWVKLFWLIKWIIIVIVGIIAWSYIQPIYQSIVDNYNKAVDTANKAGAVLDKIPNKDDIKNFGSFDALKEKFNELKK